MELIFKWNINSGYNNYSTINEVIKEWEQHYLEEITHDSEEQAMVNGLYNMYNNEWNTDKKRGQDFLEENKIDYKLIKAIEDVYICYEKECGYDVENDLLEDKLDFIFLRHAEEQMKKVMIEHDFNMDYWG